MSFRIRMVSTRSLLVAALLLVLSASPASADPPSDSPPRTIPALRIDQAPVIDGDLSDPVWQRVPVIDGFRQRSPVVGADPTERTEVRIAYDADYLYFALTFFDGEPDLIRANIFDRGGRIDKDDRVLIALDTYHDRRNAYLFEMNPLGTQDDALLTDEETLNWNWDCVYLSEGRVTEHGWQLEVAIPFAELRFSKDDVHDMGVAIQRTINRKNESDIWPYIGADYRGILQVSQYATLTGLQGLRRGRNLQVKPYVLTGGQKLNPDGTATSEFVRDAGVDVKYGITSNMTLDLTLNTDFAQVEADNVQLNLSRFSLFFPEKREFFLERAGLFGFGARREAEVFFSRRIGLERDILGGARLTGQQGPVSVGLLNLQTKQQGGLPGTNYSVARVRADVRPGLTVGTIVTNEQDPDMHNRVAGADAVYRFWASSEARAWVSNVWASDPAEADAAGGLDLALKNDRYGLELGYLNIGTNYAPGIGFVRRRDMIRYDGSASFTPRPNDGRGLIRRLRFEAGGSYIEGQDHEQQSAAAHALAMAFFPARDHVGLEVTRQFERLEAPFFIRPETEIAAGDYRFTAVTLFATSDPGRRVFVSGNVEAGSFFGGDRTQVGGSFGLRVSKHLKLEGTASHDLIRLPVANGDFDATVVGLNVEGAANRRLFAKALIQYDNFSKDLQANVRVNWIHTPGSDLFFVFNTSYSLGEGANWLRDRYLNQRAGVAKVTYLIRV